MKKLILLAFAGFVLVGCGQTTEIPESNPTPIVETNSEIVLPEADPTVDVQVNTEAPLPEADPTAGVEVNAEAILPEADPTVAETAPPLEPEPAVFIEPELSPEAQASYEAEQTQAIEAQTQLQATVVPEQMVTIKSGNFIEIDRGHKGSGSAKIIQEGEKYYLELSPNFNVTNGPDLYVYLSKKQTFGPKARNGADLNRMQLISPITSNTGSQLYELSPEDVENYGENVVIWCRAYGVLFSYANLN